MYKFVHFTVPFGTSAFSEAFLNGKIRRLSSNQSKCGMIQYASLIICFYKTTSLSIQPTFPDKILSRATIFRWFYKLKDGVSGGPSKSWQRHMQAEVVDDLVEAVGQSPYCMAGHP